MFQLHMFTWDAEHTLNRMQMQISLVGSKVIPYELEQWQIEDMHRQYPNVEQPNYVSAETTIWPRSRTYERVHKKRAAREALFRRPLSPMPRIVSNYGKPGSTMSRPILRQALYDKLRERVQALAAENLVWVTSTNELAPQVTEAWQQADREHRGK